MRESRLEMRYFTYQLVAAANDWLKQSQVEHLKAQKRLVLMTRKYQRDLEAMESCVRRKAWQFFRHGFGEESLHDASLLSLRVGDGLGFIANGKRPFRSIVKVHLW